MEKYDVIIIGAGIGGLIAANLLVMEGYKVCVLEKNKQIGGALQVYVRNRVIFDTGVHYLGGLDPGQNLHRIFSYLGIIDKLRLKRMPDVFDTILIGDDEKEYKMAQGYDRFIELLSADFPGEENAIRTYCDKLREICSKFPLYNLRSGGTYEEKAEVMGLDAKAYIASLTDNEKLQAVLAGNNLLYAGQPEKTPFYVHALILNSYIESSWKCVDGGSQISKLIRRNIHALGGVVKTHAEVSSIVEEDGRITHVKLKDGSILLADSFVSNVHPAQTLEMLESAVIRNSFRSRVKLLKNSTSSFSVDIILKPGCFPELPSNYYYHKKGRIWNATDYSGEEWPLVYALFMPCFSDHGSIDPGSKTRYAKAVSILTYMKYDEVAEWEETFNTISDEVSRGQQYEAFKKERAERLIDLVTEKFPTLRDCIDKYFTATPLTYRDYMGNGDGTMYGIAKDFQDPLKTMISPRTKLPNFYFTGQNLNMHGILGAAMSAVSTCNAILGNEDLIDRIRNA
ncbi:phytoene desaturase family protein [Flavitalea antarctica]